MYSKTIDSLDSSLSAFEEVLSRTLESIQDLRKNLAILRGEEIQMTPKNPPGTDDAKAPGDGTSGETENPVSTDPKTQAGDDSTHKEDTNKGDDVPSPGTSKDKSQNRDWKSVVPKLVLANPPKKPGDIIKHLISNGYVGKDDTKKIANARSAIWYYRSKIKTKHQ
jgi:hypothetical protein